MSKIKIVTQTDNIEGKKTKVITDNWMDIARVIIEKGRV